VSKTFCCLCWCIYAKRCNYEEPDQDRGVVEVKQNCTDGIKTKRCIGLGFLILLGIGAFTMIIVLCFTFLFDPGLDLTSSDFEKRACDQRDSELPCIQHRSCVWWYPMNATNSTSRGHCGFTGCDRNGIWGPIEESTESCTTWPGQYCTPLPWTNVTARLSPVGSYAFGVSADDCTLIFRWRIATTIARVISCFAALIVLIIMMTLCPRTSEECSCFTDGSLLWLIRYDYTVAMTNTIQLILSVIALGIVFIRAGWIDNEPRAAMGAIILIAVISIEISPTLERLMIKSSAPVPTRPLMVLRLISLLAMSSLLGLSIVSAARPSIEVLHW
jgi:hypothetical protein